MSKKISELTAASALTGAELVEVVQGGTNKRSTVQEIANRTISALSFDRTITPIGTTGDQVINKIAGTVNIASGNSSVTVTNNLVTTSSIVFTTLRDSSGGGEYILSCVAFNGSFIISLSASPPSTVSIGFLVSN